MPLPESPARTELHIRRIEMRGYRRDDGLFEIDGRVVDTKTYPVHGNGSRNDTPAGAPIHDMWVRLVVDEDLLVKDLLAVTDASPFDVCREAVAPMAKIIGERIKPGWSNPSSTSHNPQGSAPSPLQSFRSAACRSTLRKTGDSGRVSWA